MTEESTAERLQRADDLRCSLEWGVVPTEARFDMLSRYRKWLDEQEIPAETPDGWPTEQAYNDANITAFLDEFNATITEALGVLPSEETPFGCVRPGFEGRNTRPVLGDREHENCA